jgi:hypothetical protein
VKVENVTPGPLGNQVYRLVFITGEDDSVREQFVVLMRALAIFEERNREYHDNWRRQGWRGGLFKLRLKVERAWDTLWAAEPWTDSEDIPDRPTVDDLLDAVNAACFVVRSVEANDRDGSWSYPQ